MNAHRVGAHLQLAYDLIHSGDRDQAIRLLSEVLRADNRNADAWWLMAQATNPHNPVQARRAVSQLLYLRPDDVRGQALLREIDERERLSASPPGQGFPTISVVPAPSPSPVAQALQVQRHPPPDALSFVIDPMGEQLAQSVQKSPRLFLLLVFGLPLLFLCAACMLFTVSFSPRITGMFRRADVQPASLPPTNPAPTIPPTSAPTSSSQVWRGEIGYREWRRGRLTSAAFQDTYSFTGETDDYVVIDVLALDAGFKPLVALRAPTGVLLAYSEQFTTPDGRSARVSLRLPFSGTYLIYVGTYTSVGEYQLTLGKN